jgi:hypothetical protein
MNACKALPAAGRQTRMRIGNRIEPLIGSQIGGQVGLPAPGPSNHRLLTSSTVVDSNSILHSMIGGCFIDSWCSGLVVKYIELAVWRKLIYWGADIS